MAKSGKHVAPKKNAGAHLKPKENVKATTELEPQAKAENISGPESTVAKKVSLDDVKAGFKNGLKRLPKPRKKTKKKKKKLSPNEKLVRVIGILAMLIFCLLMITPLRNCVFDDDGYIGEKAAEEVAIADSGVKSGDVDTLVTDMIKLDGETCYKIEFTSDVNGYRYIVNAETGDIVAQGFYTVNNTETED